MVPHVSSRGRQLLLSALLLAACVVIYTLHTPVSAWFRCPAMSPVVASDSAPPAEPSAPDTLLLIWAWPFGMRFDVSACGSVGVAGCRLTDDRSVLAQADGVLFHHRELSADLSDLPATPRPALQKWVWMNMESPSNSRRLPGLDGLFNLTATYRRDSDVPVPYGRVWARRPQDHAPALPHKSRLVCWVVSSWQPGHERSRYYELLRRHVRVETFGGSFRRPLSPQQMPALVSSCKFYLSFENSRHTDYISEKLFLPLRVGTVPVVLGPSRSNYERVLPGDAFLHVDDFSSPRLLAERLKSLDRDPAGYLRLLRWRRHHTAEVTTFGVEHACRSCQHIRSQRDYRVHNNLTHWFWEQ